MYETCFSPLDRLCADASTAARELGGSTVETFVREHDGRTIPCIRFGLPRDIELLLIASDGYPGTPPVLLVTGPDGTTTQVNLEWNVALAAEQRLLTALREHFRGAPPYSVAFGPHPDLPLTTDPEVARMAGWVRFFSGAGSHSEAVARSLFARSSGLVSERLAQRSALIVGLGSGGSYVTENLVRSGLGRVVIVDGDSVEMSNLCRTTFSVEDLGMNKARAVARRLLNINPTVQVVAHEDDLVSLGAARLSELVESVDLVIGLTDDPYAQSRLNHFARHHGKPAVFAALYRGAQGGEVILCVPGRTPCLECATGGVRDALGGRAGEVDYGTGRLSGEAALAADIHHLDSATIKLSLGLLLADEPELAVSSFASKALDLGFSYLCMSMAPDYWVFPTVFGDTPGQFGYQAMWFTVTSREDCTVCGEPAAQENPTRFPLALPRLSALVR